MKTRAVVLTFLAILGATTPAISEEPTFPSRPFRQQRIFSSASFWYRPLPADVPLHPDSANLVREFLRQKQAYYGTVSINTIKYASPVYVVDAGTPVTAVKVWDCFHRGYLDSELGRQLQAVPIPEYAIPAEGTDSEMTIYSPAQDTIWEFWQARKGTAGWEACWGGRMQQASKNPGIWPHPYGTTATGLPFLGGQLSISELLERRIEHVMGISLVDTETWSVVSWPANRSDGDNRAKESHRIPEGLRFRLDPTVDVESLNMHPLGKAIARAAQIYGFVVWDKAGAITLRAENPIGLMARGSTNPFDRIFDGAPAWSILRGFPWERLQFLPMDYGKPPQ
jgi:hypothetical protein